MFRRPKFIVLAAVALYVIVLFVVWHEADSRADRRTQTMLESAEKSFSDVIDGEIDAALRNAGGAIINVLGNKCGPQSLERMQELARTFNIDEVNIVDRRGVVIGSNVSSVMGFDFKRHPDTRAFLMLTNQNVTIVSQPFRKGVANPEMVCRYHGVAFPGHDGFLQLGVTEARLRQNMYNYTDAESERILRDWHFSVVGWYERAMHDPACRPGKMIRRRSDVCGGMAVGRYFDYKGYCYLALLPVSYCYLQRNSAFAVTAVVLAVVLAFFTFFLVKLVRATANLEAMHTAANARTSADLALARTIQMSALPAADGAFMERLDFSLHAECRPAREVGGDFYDFFHVPGDRLAFLVADVSGKGIPGALFMMEAKNVLKNCLVEFANVAEAVAEANRRLCAENKAELFVTAWIGVLDWTGTFEYVNAGHNRPFVRRADGTVEKVMGKGGRFLGMFEDADYRENSLRLDPGDALYLYTDGITEAMNAKGEQFGERRLRPLVAAHNHRIMDTVDEFVAGAEQSDDMTGLSITWHGWPKMESRDFKADEVSLGSALAFVREELDCVDRKVVAAVLNATDEVTSNIVFYSGATGYRIEVERTADRVQLRFSDDGKSYNPLSHVDPDTHAAIEDRPVGGLGLVVVKRLADRVTYSREDGRNILSIIKRC